MQAGPELPWQPPQAPALCSRTLIGRKAQAVWGCLVDVVIGLESPITPTPPHKHTHTHINSNPYARIMQWNADIFFLFRTECYCQNSDLGANGFKFCGLDRGIGIQIGLTKVKCFFV